MRKTKTERLVDRIHLWIEVQLCVHNRWLSRFWWQLRWKMFALDRFLFGERGER